MAFTVKDFEDLLRILDRYPNWREELRRRILLEELEQLPRAHRRLSVRLGRIEKSIAALAETVRKLAQDQRRHATALTKLRREVAEARAEADRRFAELVEAQRRTEESLQRLSDAFATHREEFLSYRVEADRRFAELVEAQRRTEESLQRLSDAFAAHREEFLAYRAEADRRFAELAEAQRRTEESLAAHRAETDRRFAELAEAQRRTEESLAAHRAETDRRFAELAEAQRRTEENLAALHAEMDRRFAELATTVRILVERVDRIEQDVGVLKDHDLRRRYVELAPAYFGRPNFRKIRVLSASELADLLWAALDEGRIQLEDFEEARRVDLVLRGEWEGRTLHLALETSWRIDRGDVERAVRRARILAAILGETWPAVAGNRLTEGARELLQTIREEGQPIVVALDGGIEWPS
ncbi:Chromosome partition protein Smc [Candidatus Thermoflexus japonica]|uniref:Chromosome partition protein Smc n=1 Tax=Candidatus Thermoflexus japonica TaxID=2035417 RepID=A0A2H5Y6S2_9CHLR|nr:Chromosome partition protein Smc [Candidatus Thermoflexus japonica]